MENIDTTELKPASRRAPKVRDLDVMRIAAALPEGALSDDGIIAMVRQSMGENPLYWFGLIDANVAADVAGMTDTAFNQARYAGTGPRPFAQARTEKNGPSRRVYYRRIDILRWQLEKLEAKHGRAWRELLDELAPVADEPVAEAA